MKKSFQIKMHQGKCFWPLSGGQIAAGSSFLNCFCENGPVMGLEKVAALTDMDLFPIADQK